MNEQERVTRGRNLEVRKVNEADEEIITLLRETVLGSEGGMQYSMQNTPERIRAYGESISFMALYKRNSLKGVIGLCQRTITNRGIRYPSTYLRYLSVHSAFQTARGPKRRKERVAAAGEGFKRKILELFRDPRLLTGDLPLTNDGMRSPAATHASPTQPSAADMAPPPSSVADMAPPQTSAADTSSSPPFAADHLSPQSSAADTSLTEPSAADMAPPPSSEIPPHVFYAYVESRNERSRNLISQAGYEYIRSFLTVAFSRFNPRPHPLVKRLTPDEEPAMAELLNTMYSDYCFYTDQFSFHDHRYYVLRKEGVVVAGVGAVPAEYRMVNVPGVWGWLMMRVLPKTPLFRRLFQPESFRYIILNAIYCRKGSEALLPDLFEAVCATEGYNTALTWLDDHSQLYDTLRTNRRMGAINRMLNAKPGLVYALFSGLSPLEIEMFYEAPAYISGFDFS